MKHVIVWVLIISAYRGGVTIIDNISSREGCLAAAKAVAGPLNQISPVVTCVSVKKVVAP